jgi:undecaprenyl diphosphate synthase
MDGNGRWATERGLPRIDGHRKGADVVRDITTFCRKIGIKYLTLYSFSVQNWQRPDDEIVGLMSLLEEYCRDERDTLMSNEIRLTTIGRLDRLPQPTRDALEKISLETIDNTSMTLTLAVDYGGREELLEAVVALASEVKSGNRELANVDEAAIVEKLSTSAMPDPDLVIRTSGELRVSNFLLWQIDYAELLFTDVFWPDFTRQHFADALWDFANRQRRFGATAEQVIEPESKNILALSSDFTDTKG